MTPTVPIDGYDQITHSTIFDGYREVDEGLDKSCVLQGMEEIAERRCGTQFRRHDLDIWVNRISQQCKYYKSARKEEYDPSVSPADGKVTFSVQLTLPDDKVVMERHFVGTTNPRIPSEQLDTEFIFYSNKDIFHDHQSERTVTVISEFKPDGTFERLEYIGAMGDRLVVAHDGNDKNSQRVSEYTDLAGTTLKDPEHFPNPLRDYIEGWEHHKSFNALEEEIAWEEWRSADASAAWESAQYVSHAGLYGANSIRMERLAMDRLSLFGVESLTEDLEHLGVWG